jgi:hypothetical protein
LSRSRRSLPVLKNGTGFASTGTARAVPAELHQRHVATAGRDQGVEICIVHDQQVSSTRT